LIESSVKEKVAMHSSLIGKIDKAKRYAEEPERVRVSRLEVTFKGEHDDYAVSYDNGTWHCSCAFFAGWSVCSHTIALHRMLIPMIPREEAPAGVSAAVAGA
jgi:hypothetical protein